MQLNVESVSKQYRKGFWGLQDVSLQLQPGVIGLLGPNGAGKTSLMNILATITRPTNGRILWNDVDITRILIVDEPTVGLDPEERNRFRQLIADLGDDHIILFSTHIVAVGIASDGIGCGFSFVI